MPALTVGPLLKGHDRSAMHRRTVCLIVTTSHKVDVLNQRGIAVCAHQVVTLSQMRHCRRSMQPLACWPETPSHLRQSHGLACMSGCTVGTELEGSPSHKSRWECGEQALLTPQWPPRREGTLQTTAATSCPSCSQQSPLPHLHSHDTRSVVREQSNRWTRCTILFVL